MITINSYLGKGINNCSLFALFKKDPLCYLNTLIHYGSLAHLNRPFPPPIYYLVIRKL